MASSSPTLASQLPRAPVVLAELLLAERRVRDLAHQRVLEGELARVREMGVRLLDEDLGGGELAQHLGGVGDADGLEPDVPPRLPEDRELRRRVAAEVVERVEVHLHGGLDGRRVRGVAPRCGDARELLGEERQARRLLGDRVDHRLASLARRSLTQDGGGDRSRLLARQGPQLHSHVVASLEARRLLAPESRPRRGEHEDRRAGRAGEQVVDPRQALDVGPLHVFENDDERVVPGHPDDHVGQDEPQGVARAARVVDLGEGLVGDEAGDELARRVRARDLAEGDEHVGRVERLLQRRALGDAGEPAREFGDDAEGVALRERLAS